MKPGFPFLILFVFLILLRFVDIFGFEKFVYSEEVTDLLKDEPKQENFYEIIPESDRKWLLSEEKFLR